ncbi:protein of unknown function DUF188 [Desulfofarcimen acetoxidans DSM 771]|jgi:uncharacterized protein YaiI (UPF0178 family)|uniref:Uncharacterized protein n=1 Tax=Desulfofarcimen acetoxidans (strain ATCC 49208 / DSM 771 / KCTC 5769 / VKM B-1644 / 5575) TaxID=485916 RepID=C8VX66_DESAS|nr:DUF188 domain-containing protein [Desulfofarcimen acetoxidans]ACV62642.1 protein of unknown function DUF188 [Desulfofarcimen acetoxidans DSM 771]
MSRKIIVDADAVPRKVLHICRQAADEFSIPLWTVASFNHCIDSHRHVVVGNASQEADIYLMNMTVKDDIVVTQDWGLAAMVLGKGAAALSPYGRIYQTSTIEFLLEEREIKARFRRGGGKTKGPHKRTTEDDNKFKQSLLILLKAKESKL